MYKSTEDNRANAKRWYRENREKVLAQRKTPEWKERYKPKRRKWYSEKRQERLAYARSYETNFRRNKRIQNRTAVINFYSKQTNKCECCGEANIDFLCLDHVGNDGAKFRKETGKAGQVLHAWLVRNKFPDIGLQILCYNCNMGKQFNMIKRGVCPHNYAPLA